MENNCKLYKNGVIILGDCLRELQGIKSNSITMIFSDPPYFLSNGGISCKSGRVVSVNKGYWDMGLDTNEKYQFNFKWISECKRILNPNGTIWISGTFHNIFQIGTILNELDFKVLNMITWVKKDPPPNLSKRMFTHSSEFIIWAKKDAKSNQCFNYDTMFRINKGTQMTDVWVLPHVTKVEKTFGYHPTQKPESLLKRIILSCTKEGDFVLDPFSGSGTTAVVATNLNRRYICIEKDSAFFEIACKRIESLNS